MATSNSTNSPDLPDGLLIAIFNDGTVHFEGTSGQLVAEGLIPKNPKWPVSDIDTAWKEGVFHFSLRRSKPQGMKGPKADWITLDNWRLVRSLDDRPNWEEIAIQEKMQEIERIKFRNSREGREQFDKYWTAHSDEAFQAFKALIPGLVKPKRGRKAKEAQEAKASQI